MTITRNFKLCLNAGTQNAPYINANQYDEGEEWVFDLYTEGGQKFTPSTGAIIGIKSDGNAILNSGTVNSDGQVVITETQQMTAASGLAVFELLIEGETHGTANFIVNVERRPSDDAEFSDSDISMLQEAIDAAEVINEILDEGGDPSEIITENVNAWLDNHPEATTTVQDGAITAPKINNSLWDKILVNEEVSGNPASFEDGADDVPVSSLKVALDPIQLGSGEPSPTNIRPIIASNGKNILPLTVASCQTNSTAGTWNGNAYTHLGVTYTLNTGADGTIESVTMNGTSTGASELRIALVSFEPTKTYKVNGITGATNSTYRFNIGGVGTYYDDDYTVTFRDTTAHICRLQVPNGVEVNNATVQPMIRLDGTDATYQPYQGIIVERTGKNLLSSGIGRYNWASGVRYANNTGPYCATEDKVSIFGGQTYVVSFNNTDTTNAVYFAWFNGDTFLSNDSVYAAPWKATAPTNADGVAISIRNTNNYTGNPSASNVQLELGDTPTDYEPYAFTSYPISLGREVYGGTVDLATGVLTVDKGYLLKNTADMNNQESYPGWKSSGVRELIGDNVNGRVLGSFTNISPASAYDGSGGVGANTNGANDTVMLFREYFDKSQAEWQALALDVQIVVPLATPQTYQLTPTQVKTLLGYNNISSTGTVDVIYHADTKLYIDKKIGELS